MNLDGAEKLQVFVTDARIASDGELIICGQSSKDEDQINLLMEKIKAEVNTFHPLEEVKTGEVCVAKFGEDDQWYRGRIGQRLNNLWMVDFIDYGNVQATSMEDLRSLPEHLNVLGPQAQLFALNLEARPLNSAGMWTPMISKSIQEDYLYAEVELQIFEGKSNRRMVKCDAMRNTLFKKGLIVEESCYPFSTFPVGRKFEAYVSNCSGFGCLHIQAKKSTDELNKLMDEMAEHYGCDESSLSKQLLPPEFIETGMLVCTVYSADGGFYRGQVLSIAGEKCTVFYIDYGDSEEKPTNGLYGLPEKFAKLEYQALECELVGISFTENTTADFVSDIITDFVADKVFEVTVSRHEKLNRLVIELESTDTTQSLVQHLVEKGCVVSQARKEFSSLKYLTFGMGEKIKMVLTSVEQDGSFYCYNVDNEDILNVQLSTLYDACTGADAQALAVHTPGTFCCALFDVDGNWYRAMIMKHSSGDAAVRFVDYGNTTTCSLDSLMQLQDSFLDFPAQAVHCLLSADLHGEDLIDTLTAIKDEEVIVEFMSSKTFPYVVRLYHNGNIIGHSRRMQETVLVHPAVQDSQEFSFKKRIVSVGSRSEILIKEMDNLKSLWGILVETSPDLQALVEELNEIYNANQDCNLVTENCDPGHPCVVVDPQDRLWYRAKLLKQIGPDNFQVMYVDYGRVTIVRGEAIKIISADFLEMPVYAVQFTLLGITTCSGSMMPSNQYAEVVSMAKNKSFIAVFDSYDREKDLYFVELHDVAGHIKTHVKTPTLSRSDVDSLPSLKVALNVILPIRMTCVEDPDRIWAQLLDSQADLIVLTGRMNAFYNSVPEQSLVLKNVECGQICCLKSAKNKNWCRGLVIYSYGEIIEVKFLDFGYEEAAHLTDAKILLPEYSTLPSQAMRCCLHNVRPSSSHWTNGSVRFLKDFVAKTGVSAEFVEQKGSTYSAKMYVTSNEETILMTKCMVDDGHASWTDVNVAAENIIKIQSPVPAEEVSGHSLQVVSPPPCLFYHHPGIALIGAEVPAIVCDSASPSDFFILPRNSEVKHTYNELFAELKKSYHSHSPQVGNMYIGMPCIYIGKNECFRAAIVVEDPSHPNVFLIDFGEKLVVLISTLKLIKPEHITCLPPIAIRCTLHGVVEPQTEFWSSKAMLIFSKFSKENKRDLICSIHGCVSDGVSQFFMVRLVTPFKDVVSELTEHGSCVKTLPIGIMKSPFKLKSFVYSSLGIGIGKEDQFYVTHIERSDLFYCQLASKFSNIDNLMDNLQLYCQQNPQRSSVTFKDLAFSPPCLVRLDTKWYRAHYMSICSNLPNTAVVILVDFGNSITVPLGSIMVCDYRSGLADLPIQALPCCLSEITSPVNDPGQSEPILRTMDERLLQRQLRGMITGSTNGRFHLDLFENEKRVNESIVRCLTGEQGSPQKEEKFISKTRDCDPRLRDTFKDIKTIEPKSIHSAFITEVTDPGHFHVRLDSYKAQFQACMSEVDGFYTAVRHQDYLVTVLEPRNIVCAKHPSTLRWCRGVVIDVDSSKQKTALVEFVDIGEREYVPVEDNAKKIVPDMLCWPRMAIRCQLANLLPNRSSWSRQCLDFFSRTCRYSDCRVRFNTFDVTQGVWTVDLKISGRSVASMLVEQTYGQFIKPPSSTVSGSSVCVKMKSYEPWTIGEENEICISHVESSDVVYVQLVKSEASLRIIMDKLNDSSLSLDNLPSGPVRLDRAYVAKYAEDGQWYRVNVTDSILTMHPASYSVFYVDYGNCALIKQEDLRLLPNELATFPEQAIKCKVSIPKDVDRKLAFNVLEDLSVTDGKIYAKCIRMDTASMIVELTVVEPNGRKVKFESLIGTSMDKVNSNLSTMDPLPSRFNQVNVPTGVPTKAYVSQVDGPNRVWMQMTASALGLEEIMAQIDAFYNADSTRPHLPDRDMRLGAPCVAKYSADGGWYRAAISSAKPDQNLAKVHFVDYGNSEEVKQADLKAIDKQFLDLPAQAIMCSLKRVSMDLWKDYDTDKFVELVSDIELNASFNKLKEEPINNQGERVSTLYEVDLSFSNGNSLNSEWAELLKNRKSASPSHVLQGGGDNEHTGKDLSLETSEKHIVNDRGDHVIVENLQIEKANLDFNVSGDDHRPQEMHSGSLKSLTVKKSAREEGYVSHADNPGHFYIQLARLSSDLDIIYEEGKLKSEKMPEKKVVIGRYYAAQSPDDEEWYRAQCTKITDDGKSIGVVFIDYGNAVTVNMDRVRLLSGAVNRFPMQAVLCKLHDVEPIGESWGKETDHFLDLTLDKDLTIEFIEQAKDGKWGVKLVVGDTDVSQNMLEKNMARLKGEGEPCVAPLPVPALDRGAILCAKVMQVSGLEDLTLIVMNNNTFKIQDNIKQYIKNMEATMEGQELCIKDLKPGDFYLIKEGNSTDWNCINVISLNGDSVTVSEMESDKVTEMHNVGHQFLKLPTSLLTMIKSQCIKCSLYLPDTGEEFKLEEIRDLVIGKTCVATFLDECGSNNEIVWRVKLSMVGEDIAEVVAKIEHEEKEETKKMKEEIRMQDEQPPRIFISNQDEDIVQVEDWLSKNGESFIKSLDDLLKIQESSPSLFESHFANIRRFKQDVVSQLVEVGKLQDEHSPSSEPHKRSIQTSPEKEAHDKRTPCKKLKLDLNGNLSIEEADFAANKVDQTADNFGNLNCGQEFEAVVSKIDDLSSFFVRPFLVLSEPDAMNLKSSSHGDNVVKHKRKNLLVGSFCLAKYSESHSQIRHWVRAVILGHEDEKYVLEDLDTKHSFTGIAEDIFLIDDTELWPSLCYRCYLSGIQPKHSENMTNQWSDEAIEEFRSLVINANLEDCINVHVLTCNEIADGYTFGTDIMINGNSVIDTLVNMELAERVEEIQKEFEIDKENQNQHVSSKPIPDCSTRKPLADLSVQVLSNLDDVSHCSSIQSCDLPDFDLLAVPWRIVRTSIRSSQSENLSDSVFVSDIDDSLVIPNSARPVKLPDFSQKPLASFKIYCSTSTTPKVPIIKENLKQSMDSSATLDDDCYDTPARNLPPGLSHSEHDLGPTYVAGSPLEPPQHTSPENEVSVFNKEELQELCEIIQKENNEFTQGEIDEYEQQYGNEQNIDQEELAEMKLLEISKRLVADVFTSIEEEEEENTECNIPDFLCEIPLPHEVECNKKMIDFARVLQTEDVVKEQENALIYELAKLDIKDVDEENLGEGRNGEHPTEDIQNLSEEKCLDSSTEDYTDATEHQEEFAHENEDDLLCEESLTEIPLPPDMDVQNSESYNDSAEHQAGCVTDNQEEPFCEESVVKNQHPPSADVQESNGLGHLEQSVQDSQEEVLCEESLIEIPLPPGMKVQESVFCHPQMKEEEPEEHSQCYQYGTEVTEIQTNETKEEDAPHEILELGKVEEKNATEDECSDSTEHHAVDSVDAEDRDNIEIEIQEVIVDVHEEDSSENIESIIQDGDLKHHLEDCAHHLSKFICCLAKTQLEVGDSYQVTYMNSENPNALQIQFDLGQDSEEWRAAMCKLNDANGVDDLRGKDKWEPDMLCIVQCMTDMSWDRGRIVDVVHPESQLHPSYSVELIDYGDITTVSCSRLREISENLCLFPPQTVQCELANVSPMVQEMDLQDVDNKTETNWQSGTNQYLKDLLFCSSLRAEVIEIRESVEEVKFGINLYLADDEGKEKDVARMLINAGLAKEMTSDEEDNRKKKEEEEWSTMTDSAWETVLNPNASSLDLMHSSNIDLSNISETDTQWQLKQDGESSVNSEDVGKGIQDVMDEETFNEDIDRIAKDIQSQIVENAMVIAEIKTEDKSFTGTSARDEENEQVGNKTNMYLGEIPEISIDCYDSD